MFIIDIEASGLGKDSYPIEAAWCSLDGKETYSTLINPNTAGDWNSWDSYAEEAIHGLSRGECCEQGRSVVEVARDLKDLLENQDVYSDAPEYDQFWIQRLFDAVGERAPSVVKHVGALVRPSGQPELHRKISGLCRPHRALPDCLLLRKVLVGIRQPI